MDLKETSVDIYFGIVSSCMAIKAVQVTGRDHQGQFANGENKRLRIRVTTAFFFLFFIYFFFCVLQYIMLFLEKSKIHKMILGVHWGLRLFRSWFFF